MRSDVSAESLELMRSQVRGDPEAREVQVERLAAHRTEPLAEVVREEPPLGLGGGRVQVDPDVLIDPSAAELAHQAVGAAEVEHPTPRRLDEQPLELSREERALEVSRTASRG